MRIDVTPEMIYTAQQNLAVELAKRRTLEGRPVFCPYCSEMGHGFQLGEHLRVENGIHEVTWRCDQGHYLTCAEFIVQAIRIHLR